MNFFSQNQTAIHYGRLKYLATRIRPMHLPRFQPCMHLAIKRKWGIPSIIRLIKPRTSKSTAGDHIFQGRPEMSQLKWKIAIISSGLLDVSTHYHQLYILTCVYTYLYYVNFSMEKQVSYLGNLSISFEKITFFTKILT